MGVDEASTHVPEGGLKDSFLSLKTTFAYRVWKRKLKKAKAKLQKQLKIPANILHIDLLRPRILTSLAVVDELKAEIKELKLVPAIIEEYPTWDSLEVDVRFL